MRVSAIQLEVADRTDWAGRLDEAAELVIREAENGAELVVLPELWVSGFFAHDAYRAVAEPIGGPITQRLMELARRHRIVLHCGSVVERDGERLHNTSVVFGRDGNVVATYRKVHIFGNRSQEPEYITPGDGLAVFHDRGVGFGLSICNDLRYPELYRAQVDAGAEVILVAAAWPFPRVAAWRTLLRARAIENQAVVVACNAAGQQGNATYFGASTAINEWGLCLGELGDRPGVLTVDIDLDSIRASRRDFPWLPGRRSGGDDVVNHSKERT